MEQDFPISPAELRGTLFLISDINQNVLAIRRLLEEDDDGETEEDDA